MTSFPLILKLKTKEGLVNLMGSMGFKLSFSKLQASVLPTTLWIPCKLHRKITTAVKHVKIYGIYGQLQVHMN